MRLESKERAASDSLKPLQEIFLINVTGQDRPDHVITTSPIASIDGDTVTTHSGTVYKLGQHKWPKMLRGLTFADFCAQRGVEFAEVRK